MQFFSKGTAAVAHNAASVAVTIPTQTSAGYLVIATPAYATTVYVTGKTTTGFTLNFVTKGPTGGSTCDWVAF